MKFELDATDSTVATLAPIPGVWVEKCGDHTHAYIEINSLEELISLKLEVGYPLIVYHAWCSLCQRTSPAIEIYNDWRE